VDGECGGERAKVLFLETGRHPVRSTWMLDSISGYRLLDLEDYFVPFEDPNLIFETQNSLFF
jgi:hypothetical protein